MCSRSLFLLLILALLLTSGCKWIARPDVSGVWRGTIVERKTRAEEVSGPGELKKQ